MVYYSSIAAFIIISLWWLKWIMSWCRNFGPRCVRWPLSKIAECHHRWKMERARKKHEKQRKVYRNTLIAELDKFAPSIVYRCKCDDNKNEKFVAKDGEKAANVIMTEEQAFE